MGKSDDNSDESIKKKYLSLKGKNNERLVSGSDDFSLIIWDPIKNAKP